MTYQRKEFSEANFWNERFSEHTVAIDWYCTYKELEDTIEDYSNSDNKVLMVGCGNSKLTQEIVEARPGITVEGIDISEAVITQMRDETPEDLRDRLTWKVMDATKTSYNSNEFDLLIDKGTLDALATSDTTELAESLVNECFRVLKPEGHLILVSHSHFEKRVKFFQQVPKFELVECLRIPLNDVSSFTNISRFYLQSKPLKNLFFEENSATLAKVMAEFTKSRRERALSLMLRRFKRRRAAKISKESGQPIRNIQPPASDEEESLTDDAGNARLPRRDYSYCMVFKKTSEI
eukprot:GDKJ01061354.1.p1 GENE.GDKJ01061354.1~~GDKJ01061354.1.p1  ORF type:complete len:293 (+),score=62.16 GDKJ01061354.1:47-925(+)